MWTPEVVESLRRALSLIGDPFKFIQKCRNTDVSYEKFYRLKKNGGARPIFAPAEALKRLQREINWIMMQWPVDSCQFGFVLGGSCRDNALAHIHTARIDCSLNWRYYADWHFRHKFLLQPPRWMLRIDLSNAFPSVRAIHVQLLLESLFSPLLTLDFFDLSQTARAEFYWELIEQLVRITTHQGRMQQGPPTSPYLLNLILFHSGIIDKLKRKCQERERRHRSYCRTPFAMTVYADDIVFTSLKDKIPQRFVEEVISIIEKGGIFKVNRDKVKRNSLKHKAHIITGITLDQGKRGGARSRYQQISLPQDAEPVGKHFRSRLAVKSGEPHWIALPQKVRKTYRGKLKRTIAILRSNRYPEIEKDNLSLNQILGIRGRIRDVYRGTYLPRELKEVLAEFKIAWSNFRFKLITLPDQIRRQIMAGESIKPEDEMFVNPREGWRESGNFLVELEKDAPRAKNLRDLPGVSIALDLIEIKDRVAFDSWGYIAFTRGKGRGTKIVWSQKHISKIMKDGKLFWMNPRLCRVSCIKV